MDLPKRKNIRLKEYDYSKNGAYFITVCVNGRNHLLWENCVGANSVRPNETSQLSNYGLIVNVAINNIQKYYSDVIVNKYVIMPNHIHMIICLSDNCGRTMFAPTISRIIKQMKEYVTKQIGFSLWQKSFHDHIIRNDEEYKILWEYIDTNSLKWELDKYFFNV